MPIIYLELHNSRSINRQSSFWNYRKNNYSTGSFSVWLNFMHHYLLLLNINLRRRDNNIVRFWISVW